MIGPEEDVNFVEINLKHHNEIFFFLFMVDFFFFYKMSLPFPTVYLDIMKQHLTPQPGLEPKTLRILAVLQQATKITT